jgi:hypothetical protein
MMRKVSLQIIWYALFGVTVLVLGACVKPVSIGDFLGDERVQTIINGGITVNPGYENPEDISPKLGDITGSLVAAGAMVTVSKGSGNVTIMVTNAGDYDGGIEWFYGENRLGTDVTFTVETDKSPFDATGTYQLAARGTADGKPYSTAILIKVEE